MASLGSLIVKLAADTSDFKKGFDDARKTAGGFESVIGDLSGKVGKFLTVVGASAALGKFGKELFDATVEAGKHAEQMEQLASRTGIAAQSLEGMSVALGRVGLEHQSLAMGMQLLSRNMIEARGGSEEAKSAFTRMGIELTKVGSNEEVLRGIADQFAAMPDGAEKTALAMQLFGRSGAQMIPILNQGAAGLDAAKKKAEEFGLVLTDAERGALTKFDDKMDDLKSATMGFGTQIGVTMANAFSVMADKASGAVSMVTQLIKAMRDGGPEMDKFAERVMGALPGGSQASLSAGVGRPAPGTEKTLSAGPIPDDLSLPKKFISLEERQVEIGNQRVSQAQQAVFYAEKLGVPYREAEKATRGLSAMQFQNLLAMKQQEQKFMPAIVAMQTDIGKGVEREFHNRSDLFGMEMERNAQRIADEQELYGLGLDNWDVSQNLLSLDAERTNEKRKFVDIQAGIGSGIVASEIAATKMGIAEDEKWIDIKLRLQKGIADQAAIQYAADQSMFRSNENVVAEKMRLLDFEQEQRQAALDRMVMLDMDRTSEQLILEQDFANKRMQIHSQFPTFWEEQLGMIKQSMVFTWSSISQSFASTMAGLIQGTATWAQFFQQITNTILTTFINLGIQMLARSALNFVLQQKQDAVGTAAHEAMEGFKTKATIAGEGARLAAGIATSKGLGVSMLGQLSAVTALAEGMIVLMGVVMGNAVAMMGSIAAALVAGVVTAELAVPVSTAAVGLAIAGGFAVGAGKAAVAAAGLAAGGAIAGSLLTPMASGGIVTGPTPALVGEAGPEAIIPLSQLGSMGGTTVIENHLHLNGRELAYELAPELISVIRQRYGVAI